MAQPTQSGKRAEQRLNLVITLMIWRDDFRRCEGRSRLFCELSVSGFDRTANPASRSPATQEDDRGRSRRRLQEGPGTGNSGKEGRYPGYHESGYVNISLDYSVPIDFAVYQSLSISSPRRQSFDLKYRVHP